MTTLSEEFIPSEWKQAATPYVSNLVQAFVDQGINNPNVFAYACATVCHESSWNPNVVNTTDAAAHTGYPGAGLAQITWEANYKAVGDATGIDFVGHPEYMFDPYKSLKAQAAFFNLNGMIPYIERGDYESAAGRYNLGDFNGRNEYTGKVAHDTPLWLPVFNRSGSTPPPPSNSYTVQSEDTLFIIAERFYGDGNQWTRIRDANPGIDPNNLQIGQQLNIPA